MKFCVWVPHAKFIVQAKQNSEISTDVINNYVIKLKSDCFVEKHSALKGFQ